MTTPNVDAWLTREPDGEHEEPEAETPSASSNGVAARHSSETAEHYTPVEIVEAARFTMGRIDLDPASCGKANETVKAKEFFASWANGYLQPWFGRIFLNPPGGKMDPDGRALRKRVKGYDYADTGERCTKSSQSSAKAWWWKLMREYEAFSVSSAIFVGFSLEILQSTQTDAPEGLKLPLEFGLCFPARRVAYLKPDGTIGASPPHASVIVHVSGDPVEKDRFREVFSKIGAIKS